MKTIYSLIFKTRATIKSAVIEYFVFMTVGAIFLGLFIAKINIKPPVSFIITNVLIVICTYHYMQIWRKIQNNKSKN